MEPPSTQVLCVGSLLLGESLRAEPTCVGWSEAWQGRAVEAGEQHRRNALERCAVGRLRACRGRCRTSLAAELPVQRTSLAF